MNQMEIRQYEMLVRVRAFGAGRRDVFPDASLAGQAFARVAAAVSQLSEHAIAGMTARPQPRGTTPTPRRALVDALRAIGRTARTIKAADPAFDNRFTVPRRQPGQGLLAAGRSFAREVEPIAARFVAHEMPATFVADLQRLVDALEESLRARDARKDARIAARVLFESALTSGLRAVQMLDVLVRNRLATDPPALAVWTSDRRIDYPVRRRGPASPAPAVMSPPPGKTPSGGADTGSQLQSNGLPAAFGGAISTTGAHLRRPHLDATT